MAKCNRKYDFFHGNRHPFAANIDFKKTKLRCLHTQNLKKIRRVELGTMWSKTSESWGRFEVLDLQSSSGVGLVGEAITGAVPVVGLVAVSKLGCVTVYGG